MELLLGILTMLAVFGGGGYLFVRRIRRAATRGREVALLAERGVPAAALVTKVERIRRNRAGYEDFFVTYRYSDASGNEFDKRLKVTPGDMKGMEEGGAVDVIYLPSDPSVGAVAHLVEKMRGALGESR